MQINFDATSTGYLHCFRRFFNRIVLGHQAEGLPNNDTEYGSAWHHFRETLARTRNPMLACQAGLKYFGSIMDSGMHIKNKKEHLNMEHLSQLMMRYISIYGVERSFGKWDYLQNPKDNTPLTEQVFDIAFLKLGEYDFHLQGTVDGLLQQNSPRYPFFEDDKTTSYWDRVGYLRGLDSKIQLRFYRLALTLLSEMEGGEWYRELLSQNRIGARYNIVFLKPNVDECEFEHSKMYFYEDWEINELREELFNLCYTIKAVFDGMHKVIREGFINGTCEGKFSVCEFINPCCANKEETYEKLLANFPKRQYEPLNFRTLEV